MVSKWERSAGLLQSLRLWWQHFSIIYNTFAAAVMAVVVYDRTELIIWWVSDNVDLPVEAEIDAAMRQVHATECLLCLCCRCNLEM